MKIKEGFVIRKIAGQYMAVPVGARAKELHGMIGLNETAIFLWELLKQNRSEEELAALLYNEYEISEEKSLETVQKFCKTLQKEGVLENV